MSGLAALMKEKGKKVSGSDKEENASTHFLKKLKVKIFKGHSEKNVGTAHVVIRSLAVSDSNPEVRAARLKKIPVITYPEAVGELTQDYYTIAICGTHGKSTTTAMIAKTLIENNFDPTVIVGTKLKELGGQNYRLGKSSIFVLEACEYKRAFLHYNPRVIVLHTLDPDHLDYYKNFADYLSAFKEFVHKLPSEGYLFSNSDDPDVAKLTKEVVGKHPRPPNLFGYGTSKDAYFSLQEKNIFKNNIFAGDLHLKIPGQHNRMNALAAFSVSSTLGITPTFALKSLNNYGGASRRFEMKGKLGKTLFIDDYGHHPAEIQATLQAAREQFPKEKICVVFQPHQYNRTKNLLKEFGKAFTLADLVIVPNIYGVRDSKEDAAAVSPEMLVKEIKKHKTPALYGEGLENTAALVKEMHKEFDVVFTMGAGDVWKIADELIKS